jgi:Fic family protein
MNKIASKPFAHTFLSQFVLIQKLLPFSDDEIKNIDMELAEYEQVFLNPDIEKNLISRNELLASFAISKAENSTLTFKEAQNVYNLLLSNEEYTFISDKLKREEKLTQKDYDKLEFYNIAKTFRSLNEAPFSINNITADDILKLHQSLSLGLDVFRNYLLDFTVYKSGKFRDNDLIRVGTYVPAPFKEIEKGVEELLSYLKANKTITGVAVFHTSLYALHPFNNGNKRVCRILEHIFFQDLGLNQKNLYSTSYYYHKQKQRYYKYLLYSLERRNLNHFVSFVQEALVLSMIGVLKLSLAAKRSEFLSNQTSDEQILLVLKPLIKRQELQFKNLFVAVRGKIARQTFVNQLQKAADGKIVLRREAGRTTYYSLNFNAPEEEALIRWLTFAKKKLGYIPDEIKLL